MPFLYSAFKLSDIQSPSAGRCCDNDDDVCQFSLLMKWAPVDPSPAAVVVAALLLFEDTICAFCTHVFLKPSAFIIHFCALMTRSPLALEAVEGIGVCHTAVHCSGDYGTHFINPIICDLWCVPRWLLCFWILTVHQSSSCLLGLPSAESDPDCIIYNTPSVIAKTKSVK